ncbi:MAG: hypothetical protein ACREJB_00050 [Planctomycetaceae bacterium]
MTPPAISHPLDTLKVVSRETHGPQRDDAGLEELHPAVKRFVEQAGGLEKARQALDALAATGKAA